jgi:hypothetical protein
MARPRLEGNHITGTTFKLRPELLPIVTEGANALSRQIARAHPRKRMPSPSNALWLRSLVEYTYEHSADATPDAQLAAMAAVVEPVEKPIPVSMKIPEEQRVKLRKIECFVQALDWTIDFNRNAVLNFMVLVYGERFNQTLESRLSPP